MMMMMIVLLLLIVLIVLIVLMVLMVARLVVPMKTRRRAPLCGCCSDRRRPQSSR